MDLKPEHTYLSCSMHNAALELENQLDQHISRYTDFTCLQVLASEQGLPAFLKRQSFGWIDETTWNPHGACILVWQIPLARLVHLLMTNSALAMLFWREIRNVVQGLDWTQANFTFIVIPWKLRSVFGQADQSCWAYALPASLNHDLDADLYIYLPWSEKDGSS